MHTRLLLYTVAPIGGTHQWEWVFVLDDGIKVWVVVTPSKLQKATVCAIPNPDEEGLSVRTEWHPWYLAKEVDFLLLAIPAFDVEYMHEICRLCHRHESSIRWVANRPNGSKVTLQSSDRLWQVAYIPNSTGFVLVSGSKCETIGMPRWCKRVVQVSTERCNNLWWIGSVLELLIQALTIYHCEELFIIISTIMCPTDLSTSRVNQHTIWVIPNYNKKLTIRAQGCVLQA